MISRTPPILYAFVFCSNPKRYPVYIPNTTMRTVRHTTMISTIVTLVPRNPNATPTKSVHTLEAPTHFKILPRLSPFSSLRSTILLFFHAFKIMRTPSTINMIATITRTVKICLSLISYRRDAPPTRSPRYRAMVCSRATRRLPAARRFLLISANSAPSQVTIPNIYNEIPSVISNVSIQFITFLLHFR